MPPHPAVAAVRHAVRPYLDAPALVACSGGADSLALAACAAFEADRAGAPLGLITIDHGLQAGSARQARRVAVLGYELGLDPVEVVTVAVGTGAGPEGDARAARYTAIDEAAEALGRTVLLGHTLDDQAETVLLGLARGSGPRSIAGMRPRSGRYLRPLLGIRRADTVAACAALGLQPWHDPHNADLSFLRVRLRSQVLPILEDVLSGGVAEALARTAGQLQDDLDALDQLAGEFEGSMDTATLAELPRALRSRVLRTWAGQQGAGLLSAVHVAALDALVTGWHGQGPLELPGGVRVTRRSGTLVALPTDAQET